MDKTLAELISLKNKKAVITGAASGIGKAIAYRFVEAGADLILIDRDAEGLQKLKTELTNRETNSTTYSFDLSDKNEIDRFWGEVDGESIDILVNNAGMYPFKKFLELDEAYLEKVMSVNLFSVLWMCQRFIQCRIKKGGVIVNIGSIEAIMPFKKDLTHYSVSKVGVITLTRDLARDFGRKGFRVNAVIPGGIVTKGTKGAAARAVVTLDFSLISDTYNFMQRLPIGRLGTPDEIARMILVLSSDLASYVQGALVPVDGGFLSS